MDAEIQCGGFHLTVAGQERLQGVQQRGIAPHAEQGRHRLCQHCEFAAVAAAEQNAVDIEFIKLRYPPVRVGTRGRPRLVNPSGTSSSRTRLLIPAQIVRPRAAPRLR